MGEINGHDLGEIEYSDGEESDDEYSVSDGEHTDGEHYDNDICDSLHNSQHNNSVGETFYYIGEEYQSDFHRTFDKNLKYFQGEDGKKFHIEDEKGETGYGNTLACLDTRIDKITNVTRWLCHEEDGMGGNTKKKNIFVRFVNLMRKRLKRN